MEYVDWNGALKQLLRAYKAGEFCLIIGPKGTGKTALVRAFAQTVNKKLREINFSLRTREVHLVGSKTLEQNSTKFVEGILPQSMKEGSILYLDEVNAAEPDVLLRLNEALDDRRQLVLKENGGELIKASKEWYVVATINPLSHAGTKELPPQLLSRFPIRIYMPYPPADVEEEIVKAHGLKVNKNVKNAIKLANKLRGTGEQELLPYVPSIRETIAFARLIDAGTPATEAARLVYANVYAQYGALELQKIKDLIVSIFGKGKEEGEE